MKRNIELIRSLLLKLEALEESPGAYYSFEPHDEEIKVEGYDRNAIAGHMSLLVDAGLIDAEDEGHRFGYRRITWAGHDFLDSVRDEQIWKMTKEGLFAARGFTFDLVLDVAKGFARKFVEDKIGIKL